ncbi:retrovirus-related pol polyprotein from transposon TNT 1-94 [Tanacetum coccineum]|uniref:Retrovirus-related pol polyprotein from transposon TNT 1-94 n=1 Tax=Tanacetum coccineum TaxID=301880 RepID=A0ABQ5I205_9ASTR
MYQYVCPAVGFTCVDTMADMNTPADDVLAEQAPAIAPPIRTDDQILPLRKWVPIGKSNYVLDVLKSQRNPIFKFWDTMRYDSTTGLYSCQLDEQWFNLPKDILRDALQITPINDNDPFMAPPSSDAIIEYVNTLGYPWMLKNVSVMSGIIHRFNIDYAERIWEEFVQSIQTFLTDKKSLLTASCGKKKSIPLLIPSIRFTKLIIHHLKTMHNIHPRTGSPLHYSHKDHVLGTLRSVRKDDAERGMAKEEAVPESPKATKVTKPKAAMQTKPPSPKATKVSKPAELVKETPDEPSPAKRSNSGLVGKRYKPKSPLKLVDEFANEGVPILEPRLDDEEADYQRVIELSLKDLEARNQEVQGKGKEKVIEEQAAYDLLTLQTPKKKSPTNQYIFQRRTPMTTGPSRSAESPSLNADLALADSETESDEIMTHISKEKDASNRELTESNVGVQDEGQVGSNPGKQDEGQAGSNLGNVVVFHPQPSHVVHSGPNLEPMDLAVFDASTQQNPEHLDEEFTTTAYPNVQENLKLPIED